METDTSLPNKQMECHQTSCFGVIWTEGPPCVSKFAYRQQDKSGGTFILAKYGLREEALKICSYLQQRPLRYFATVLNAFEVEGQDGYFLALKKLGDSLEDFLVDADNRKRLYYDLLMVRITAFYQHILEDLLVAVRSSIDSNIECTLDLGSIYILPAGLSPWPHISLTHFKWRGHEGSNSDFKKLAPVVKGINRKIIFPNGRKEMEDFVGILETFDRAQLERLSTHPLFWTPEERRLFPCQLSAVINEQEIELLNGIHCPFTDPNPNPTSKNVPTYWRSVVEADVTLKLLKQSVDKHGQVARHKFSLEEREMRECLNLIEKCISRFPEMTKTLTLQASNEDEVAKLFESAFDGYMLKLQLVDRALEGHFKTTLMPRKKRLNGLYKMDCATLL